jgi:signal transduction histidine kinase
MKTLPDSLARYFNGARDTIDKDTLAKAQTDYTQEVVARLEERIRHLEAVNAELARLDRMKESFIQITAHELRTPLTVIYGYSRMIETLPAFQTVLEGDDVARTAVGGLADSVRRMQSVINEIVVMSRIITKKVDLKLAPLTLGAVLEKALVSYRSAILERRLTIRYQPKEWATTIRGDVDLMTLVFSNLLSNAIKYTPDGGTITLSASMDQQTIRLSIQDTGIGIGEERATIFERFYTSGDTMLHSTSKTAFGGGGLGLGLAISKGVIEAHGGRIWVESPGRDPQTFPGSTFFVSLPLDAKNAG